MRTSLNRTKQIDDHLLNRYSVEDNLVFQALQILDPGLKIDVMWQKKTLYFIRQYGRRKLKAEIDAVHQQLFNKPIHLRFRYKILNLFK
jgi:hypothetical protein